MHQRERGNLPELNQTSTQHKPSHFSKSAPNLDKSRAAAAIGLSNTSANDSSTSALSLHNNVLGKSVDGLNIPIQTNNNHSTSSNHKKMLKASGSHSITSVASRSQHSVNDMERNNSSNSTKTIGSADRLNNNNDRFVSYVEEETENNDEYYDDDDNTEKTGCFSFISRSGDDSYMKRKKHSLDSKTTE